MFTPQETYIIALPHANKNHIAENHHYSNDVILRCLSQLITKHYEDSSSHNSHGKAGKRPLEMFVFLKKANMSSSSLKSIDGLDDIIQKSKKKYMINFINQDHSDKLNCCNGFNVYEDMKRLSICNGIDSHPNTTSIKNEKCCKSQEKENTSFGWYKASSSVKRYDCKAIKGKQVWEYTL